MNRLARAAAAAVLIAAPLLAQAQPTPAEAKAFVEKAEAELSAQSEYVNRLSWVRATYITEDTLWLDARAQGELKAMMTRYAKGAAHFDGVAADPVTKRKLKLLKLTQSLPAPDRPGAAAELAGLESRLDAAYSTGKLPYKGQMIPLDQAEDIMAASRDPAELRAVWEGWQAVGPPMRQDYARLVALSNEGARELGFKDVGALWRSNYDMEPDAFAAETDRLWRQVEPLYRKLHCYVRARLNDRYGDAVQPRTGPIRADLLGNMWAQDWSNIYDVVAPKNAVAGVNLDAALQAKGYDPVKMTRTGEAFFSSLGFPPLPETFWTRSMLVRPRDREVVCHASAWDLNDRDDLRIKACFKVKGEDFVTVHHELGHNYYQRAYADQPYLYRGGANDGFHEAIGDLAGLSAVTPTYLSQIGLIDQAPGADQDIPFLLKTALDKAAFLPFGLIIDKWRWEVFSGEVKPADYNAAWWALRTKYQGIAPPGPRPAEAFDPGAKYHIPGNVPYMRYFLAFNYEFQFHRAACRQMGWKGPLHRCSIYGRRDVGEKLAAMLAMGQSRPWPEAMAAFTGEKRGDASALTEYFRPLDAWLTRETKGERCGW
jgi:peptidyl-dipeptidase A